MRIALLRVHIDTLLRFSESRPMAMAFATPSILLAWIDPRFTW
jgi:hypothetical protein